MSPDNKHVTYNERGDKLQVIIRDSLWNKIYDRQVSLSCKKDVSEMINELSHFGVDILQILKKKRASLDTDWF